MGKVADRNDLGAPGLAAWRGMLITHSRVIAALDEELEREHGLPLGSYEVLLHLADAPEHSLRMGQLADRLLLSRSGLTRLVDRLAAQALVERHSCPSDRRGTYARLTAAGLERFEGARPTHLRGVREHFLSHLSDRDLDHLASAWEKISGPGT
ncbi:MAG: MarR family transcriptional regulator [Actinomycetota bacterium]|nr:MarR family transcriptional regulator [Actinomycetota bacterium]